MYTFDTTCLTNTGMYGDCRHITVFKLFKVLFKDSCYFKYVFPQATFRCGKISIIDGISCSTGHINRYFTRTKSGAKPRTSELGDAK